jgi:hypothetical protein
MPDINAFVETVFRTPGHQPEFPAKGFGALTYAPQ